MKESSIWWPIASFILSALLLCWLSLLAKDILKFLSERSKFRRSLEATERLLPHLKEEEKSQLVKGFLNGINDDKKAAESNKGNVNDAASQSETEPKS